MRKVVAHLMTSTDGAVDAPEVWAVPYADGAVNEDIFDQFRDADALMLGRGTYELFSRVWPREQESTPIARFLNRTPKFVASRSHPALPWGPATLVDADPVDWLTSFCAEPGKNVLVDGSPRLVRYLLSRGAIDELHLNICPIVVTSGSRWFGDLVQATPMELVTISSSPTGVVNVRYRLSSRSRIGRPGANPGGGR